MHCNFNYLGQRNIVFRTETNQIRDIIGLFDRCKGLQTTLTLITKNPQIRLALKFTRSRAWSVCQSSAVSRSQGPLFWTRVCAFVRLFAGEQLIAVETTESDLPGVDSVDRVLCALGLLVTQSPRPPRCVLGPLVSTRPAVPSRWRAKSSFYTLAWCNAVC